MIKFIHTSDLHFTGTNPKDLQYCKKVTLEILNLAQENQVDFLLLAGDVFNEYGDIEESRTEFLDIVKKFSIPIYAITGNHEYLRKSSNKTISSFHLDPVHWFFDPPFRLLDLPNLDCELAVIPYSTDYKEYRKWDITKPDKPRILIAHGMVPEAITYTGPSDEEGSHILEMDMLKLFQADYIALGHIHKKTRIKIQGTDIFYPGSPRVWRKGDSDPRTVNLVSIESNHEIRVKELEIPSAGVSREIKINVRPNGDIPDSILESGGLDSNDFIYMELAGFTDREEDFKQKVREFESKWKPKFFDFKVNLDSMKYMEGISNQPIVKNFLKHWSAGYQNAKDDREREIMMQARQIGLESISERLQS